MSSIYNNPELEMMAKEIQAMLVEKLQIEKECQESYTNILIQFTDPLKCRGVISCWTTRNQTLQ